MEILRNLTTKYSSLQIALKSFLFIVIVFLIFFAINLFINFKNKSDSAYNILSNEQSMVMLQDTRVHNWSEVENKVNPDSHDKRTSSKSK